MWLAPSICQHSTARVVFCSDQPLCFTAPSGQETWSYYKVVMALGNIGTVNPTTMSENPSERQLSLFIRKFQLCVDLCCEEGDCDAECQKKGSPMLDDRKPMWRRSLPYAWEVIEVNVEQMKIMDDSNGDLVMNFMHLSESVKEFQKHQQTMACGGNKLAHNQLPSCAYVHESNRVVQVAATAGTNERPNAPTIDSRWNNLNRHDSRQSIPLEYMHRGPAIKYVTIVVHFLGTSQG
ncbi:GEM-like protein 5 [Tanacetum coccineum]